MELKLEINNRKITRQSHNIWRLNNTLLNNTWVKEELSGEIFKCSELSENENTTYQNLWMHQKQREIHSTECTIQKRRSNINNLSLYLMILENKQIKPKINRKREITQN